MDKPIVDRSETRRVPLSALKALGSVPGIACGPLSPLARIAAPEGQSDLLALVAALEDMRGDWGACPAALLDPGLSLAMVVASRDEYLVGQYAWADRNGLGAGFRFGVANAALDVQGPWTLEDVEFALLDQLALDSCAEVPPERFTLDAAQLWTLLALVDALATETALRHAARASGPPPGVSLGQIEAGWRAGLERPNPGWAVSLAALLVPDAVPADFPELLRGALAALQEAGLVALLECPPGEAPGHIVMPTEGLELLCRGLAHGGIAFGLARSERVAADRVESSCIAGWRTPGGIVVAELSALAEDRAEILVTGPSYCAQLLGELLGTTGLPEDATAPADPVPSPGDLIARLRTGAVPAAPAHCPHCGAVVGTGARFCGQCGKAQRD